jgi:cytochrome c
MELNKAIAALLIAGIAFFVTGTIGTILVHPKKLDQIVLKIDVPDSPAAGKDAGKQVELPPIGPLLSSADVAAGEASAKKLCAQCHTFVEGGKNGVGPNIYNVMGSARGQGAAGFNFSAALKGFAGNWGYDDMNKWLAKPSSLVAGSRMTFAGVRDDQQRANIVAYLRTLSKNPIPLP